MSSRKLVPSRNRSLSLLTLLLCGSTCFGQDVLTYHNNNARTGLNARETILTTSNVNVAMFGKLFKIPVDGKVDAQPLYLSGVMTNRGKHNLLIVATEHDSILAFDADTGANIWHITTLKSGERPSDDRGCRQVTPEIGVTSTPVISRPAGTNGVIYAVAMSKDATGNYHQRLHALDAATGKERPNGPVEIEAKYPGTGDDSSGGFVIFDPSRYKERSALLLLNGMVYLAFASHGDFRPYTGWIIGYNATTLVQTTVLNVTPNGSQGAFWGSGAGLAADGNSNIYALVANGVFDSSLNANGFPSDGDYGNAFLKLRTEGGLAVTDYFEMYNEVLENSGDGDLGSSGPLVLPLMKDSSNNIRRLAVGGGKDTNLYVVNRDNMGKFNANSNNIYQELLRVLPGGLWSMPAYANGRLYFGPVNSPLLAFQFKNAKLLSAPVARSSNSFAYPGATPSISSNAGANTIVWATENTDPAILHAYDASNLDELYNSNQASNARDRFGDGNKFITPTIAGGKVFVGTTNGVAVFGLLK